MKEIVVLTKYTEGNNEVGNTKTIVRVFDKDLPFWQVYEQMKRLGNWDIVIPHCQDDYE